MPDLADVGNELAAWIGHILPGVGDALESIGADAWAPGEKEVVLRLVGDKLIEEFECDGLWEIRDVDTLKKIARDALAQYVLASSWALHLRRHGS